MSVYIISKHKFKLKSTAVLLDPDQLARSHILEWCWKEGQSINIREGGNTLAFKKIAQDIIINNYVT